MITIQDTIFMGTAAPASGGGGGSVDAVWGAITGTLSDQTDLVDALAAKQDTIDSTHKLSASLVSGLANVATSGSYADLTNKPTIPTVIPADNSTITENASNQLQTVGIVNQNTASGAISPLKVWNGTEQEWNTGGGSQTWYNWEYTSGGSWTRKTAGVSALLFGITYGNNKFIAVGDFGTILSSTDGSTWTSETSGVSDNLCSVTYGNNKFIAVGYKGTILSSSDGSTWTSDVLSDVYGNLFDVTYGNNKFIAVGSDAIFSSSDGNTWTSETSGVYGVNGVTYGNNKFIAVGDGGTILSSSDGSTWTSETSGVSNDLYGITYGNNKFIAVGNNYILSSSDGSTWTIEMLTAVKTILQDVTYGNNKFIAVGDGGTILSSSDGSTWISETSGVSNDLESVTYGNNKFIAVGYGGTILSYSAGVCYTLESVPTTASTVYSEPSVTSALTITAVGTGTITLSDTNTYNYNESGNQTTTSSVGQAHPDYLCNIDGVGVKIGTTDVANLASYTAGTNIAINNGVISATDTTYSAFVGATSQAAGSSGLVPSPATGDREKYLKGDGTWAAVSGLQNVATKSSSLSIAETITGTGSVNFGTMYNPSSSNRYDSTVSMGIGTYTGGIGDVVIGSSARAFGSYSTAIGISAYTRQNYSIQLGYGENNEAKSFYVGFYDTNSSLRNNYKLLDGTTGKIPNDRINGVSGSFTSQDGKTVTVTNGVITSIVGGGGDNVNLTFTIDDPGEVDTLVVNGTTYTDKDFGKDSIILEFPSGTSITWSITLERATPNPAQGNLTLTSDTTIHIDFTR